MVVFQEKIFTVLCLCTMYVHIGLHVIQFRLLSKFMMHTPSQLGTLTSNQTCSYIYDHDTYDIFIVGV
jgi:hypothetical protein